MDEQQSKSLSIEVPVKKSPHVNAEFGEDQQKFLIRQELYDKEINGSANDSDIRVSGEHNGSAEINNGIHEQPKLDTADRFFDDEKRYDEEPSLELDDQEPLLMEEPGDEAEEGESSDKARDPSRHVHVEGTNVSSSHEGEIDLDGYRIDQHQETEHFSHTREVRELSDHLEIVQNDNRVLKLEEVKTKETIRQATAEEMKALLGAKVFDDKDEIELGTEIVVEGFTRVEQTHEETDAGGVTSKNVTVTETREREEVHEDPNKPQIPSLEGNAPTKEDYQNQCKQMSGNNIPAVTDGKNFETESSQRIPETASPAPVKTPDKPGKESKSPGNGKQTDNTSADDSTRKLHGSAEDVLRDKKDEKVHRGGFFCKQKHKKNSSKNQSPASTLERDASLTGDEKSKGWSLFGRKSSRGKNTPDKKGKLDTSKSDHSNIGDESFKEKSATNSLDRSRNSKIESPNEIKEEKLTKMSTSSNQESQPKQHSLRRASVNSITSSAILAGYSAVVAIDLGATVSSYGFCFTQDDPDAIYSMRKPEGSDPGLIDPKYPTALLLTPEGEFHSYGFTARNVYQSMSSTDAVKWMYFDSFRKQLAKALDTTDEPIIKASNGLSAPAAVLLEHALKFLSYEAMQDLMARRQGEPLTKVRWVITAPAGWHTEARHWIRQVAYKVGLATPDFPQQLLVMQEPQAAAVAVHQLQVITWYREYEQQLQQRLLQQEKEEGEPTEDDQITQQRLHEATLKNQAVSVLVNCGGDDVSVSVYDIKKDSMTLLYQSLAINCGGAGVNDSFVKLLHSIFSEEFVEDYKGKKPAGWADLISSFECYKRSLDPIKANPLNVPLPFSFIEHHQKHFGYDVEIAIENYGKGKEIMWTQQGMLRLYAPAWMTLFRPVLDKILDEVRKATSARAVQNIEYIWLVGGFSECPSLQHEIRNNYKQLQVIVPKDTSHVAATGAVAFGTDPVRISFNQANDVAIPTRAR